MNSVLGWVLFSIFAVGYFSLVIWHLVLELDLFEKVNDRLPPQEQFSLIGGHRHFGLWRKYKVLFPNGTLHKRCLLLLVISMACLFGAVATFSVFHLTLKK